MFVMFALMFAMQAAEQNMQKMFIEDANPPSNLEKIADALRKEEPTPEPVPQPYPEPQEQVEPQGMHPQGVTPLQILQDSQRIIAEAQLENIDVVLTDNLAVEISVRGPLLFDLGRADLKPAMQQFLDNLAVIIARNNFLINVVGHTDNFPISTEAFPTNWELSSARAARVARYLITAGKLNPARFTIVGQSMYRPSVPQTSLANKAKNRRVAIIITPEEYKP
jgi:chemotaxis protein MotB